MSKRKKGRPPAPWVCKLTELNEDESISYSYSDLNEKFGVSINAAQAFCKKLNIKPEYILKGRHAVRVFPVHKLKQAATDYIESKI